MLAYLSRYTHRVAISNSRLLKTDGKTVTFRVKNYRVDGFARYTTMTLDVAEFIRRFLLHVLPKGHHRIRHYGLFANGTRVENIAVARKLLGVTAAQRSRTRRQRQYTTKKRPTQSRRQPSPSLTHLPVHAVAAKCASLRSSIAARKHLLGIVTDR